MSKILTVTLAVALLALVAGAAGTYFYLDSEEKIISKKVLSSQEVGQKAVDFIKDLSGGTVQISLVSAEEEGEMYKLRLKMKQGNAENENIIYITKDGKYLFSKQAIGQAVYDLDPIKVEIPKNDKPDVKLFVMTYCPYGLQAQKAFLPVMDLLKDKANLEIAFVDYIMHDKKEIDENLRQYCIQKEQKDKYSDYVKCFTINKKEDFKTCLSEVEVDQEKMDSCVLETDSEYKITEKYEDKSTWRGGKYPLFDVHKNLVREYGVSGSPTLVVNGAVVTSNQSGCPQDEEKLCVVDQGLTRSPEKFKQAICKAFNIEPTECSKTLSINPASPGFGSKAGTSSGDSYGK